MHSSLDLIFKEARIRASWTLLCILVTCGYCYWFSEYLLFVLTKPFLLVSKPNSIFICTQLTESLNTYITTSFLLCFCFCTPYLIYQIWCFFIPSCNETQRAQLSNALRLSGFAFFFVFLLTLKWIMPFIWFFLYKLSTADAASRGLLIIKLQPKIYDFIILTLRFFLIASLCSQLPVLIICCIEYNLIDLQDCIKHRRTFLFLSVLFAAFVTPPDIWCQMAAWLPIYVIIELTIFTALIRLKYKCSLQ
uniref:SecY-independent transporter protein n=1 Tax=Closterium baillyanum TaxID=1416941 RepID=U5YDT0_9VIRI|nr:SecY-independent transporter protein [Closterium baillyanum]AGZ90239.1 SecY-independent transporter protein [Closterium baillyanum]